MGLSVEKSKALLMTRKHSRPSGEAGRLSRGTVASVGPSKNPGRTGSLARPHTQTHIHSHIHAQVHTRRVEQGPKRIIGEFCYVRGGRLCSSMMFLRKVSLALWDALQDAAALGRALAYSGLVLAGAMPGLGARGAPCTGAARARWAPPQDAPERCQFHIARKMPRKLGELCSVLF